MLPAQGPTVRLSVMVLNTLIILLSLHQLKAGLRATDHIVILSTTLEELTTTATLWASDDEASFSVSITEHVFPRPDMPLDTPNFYELLANRKCLPVDQNGACFRCLIGANNCTLCQKECGCYCKALCHLKPKSKFVSKEWSIKKAPKSRDPSRFIPRIIHQTWFEELSQEFYPKLSRLQASFRYSGWEYRFYTDEESASFLSKHFPSEVRDAYDTLLPGAYKADLFRYCVLLIHGGLYADIDILLESNLDFVIKPSVGFMVPYDNGGRYIKSGHCVWNGFLAAAPGHPFVAKAIETVVNQVRNKFTSLDIDSSYCPNPQLAVLHRSGDLFTSGPCLLGSVINSVIGRGQQTQFEAGTLNTTDSTLAEIPGRTLILTQSLADMGQHRFSLWEDNMVVGVTALPNSNDLHTGGKAHYSSTFNVTQTHGVDNVYSHRDEANEDIRFSFAQTS